MTSNNHFISRKTGFPTQLVGDWRGRDLLLIQESAVHKWAEMQYAEMLITLLLYKPFYSLWEFASIVFCFVPPTPPGKKQMACHVYYQDR